MAYTVLLEGWNYNAGEEETTGTRVLLEESGGPASLPSLGDTFPQSEVTAVGGGTVPAGCTCRGLTASNSGGVAMWTCTYSTRPLSGFDIEPEDEPDSLSVSTTIEPLLNDGNKAGLKEDGGNPVKLTVLFEVTTAEYTQTKVYSSLAGAITGSSTATIGRVLDDGSTKDGNWRYSGMDASQYRDNTGTIKYRIIRRYKFRRVIFGANDYGWNYFWSPKAAAWRLTNPLIYPIVASFPDTMPAL